MLLKQLFSEAPASIHAFHKVRSTPLLVESVKDDLLLFLESVPVGDVREELLSYQNPFHHFTLRVDRRRGEPLLVGTKGKVVYDNGEAITYLTLEERLYRTWDIALVKDLFVSWVIFS